jgi:hypothetical protein
MKKVNIMSIVHFISMNNKNREVYSARSVNINVECGLQVEKGWARLVYNLIRVIG